MSEQPKKHGDGMEVVGDTVVFRVGERTWTLPKASKKEMTADIATVNAHLQSRRKGPIEAVMPELEKLKGHPEMQKFLMTKAYDELKKGETEKHVTNEDLSSWLDTMPGIQFTMGLAFRRVYPETTDDDLLEILVKVGGAEMQKARDILQGQALKELGA